MEAVLSGTPNVRYLVSRLRSLPGCIIALLLLCAQTWADEYDSPLRMFGIDEIRLGAMKTNLEGRHGEGSVTFVPEAGIDVNAELLFASPLAKSENPIVDFLLRPRPILGATVNTQSSTSQAYLGAAWSLPILNVLFIEGTFGG